MLDVIFDDENILINLQKNNSPSELNFDLTNELDWYRVLG
jgi:hypothetical protein